jgi:hypothetical protein
MTGALLRRFAVLAVTAGTFLAFGAGQALALCTGVTPVGTAALPADTPDSLVPEHVDATGCDVGLYYTSGTHLLQFKHVFGARQYGILIEGTANVTVLDSSVFDIEDDPMFTGVQHGVAVAVRSGTAAATVGRTQIYDFQKNGFAANGAGARLDLFDSVVRGKGPTPVIAQNGVQFSNGAVGSVTNNFIEDHQYTGCSFQQSKDTGCEFVVSTGILLFNVDPNDINRNNNTFRDNDANVLNAQ